MLKTWSSLFTVITSAELCAWLVPHIMSLITFGITLNSTQCYSIELKNLCMQKNSLRLGIHFMQMKQVVVFGRIPYFCYIPYLIIKQKPGMLWHLRKDTPKKVKMRYILLCVYITPIIY